MPTTQETIDQAKGDYLQAKERLAALFAATPDDRVSWSPSPTARTPIRQVVHAADAVRNIQETMSGRTFQAESVPAADAAFRDRESQFTTREQAVELLEKNSADYLAWLDALTAEKLDTMVTAPFGLGEVPMTRFLIFPPLHMRGHIAQLEYIQTIYGDHDWHM